MCEVTYSPRSTTCDAASRVTLMWLAYNLCEHPRISYDEARWDDATMRTDAVKTMKDPFRDASATMASVSPAR